MSRRTDHGPLRDMRHFAGTAIQLFEGVDPNTLEGDTAVHFALRYLVVTVGGAAQRVSPEFRTAHPEMAWRKLDAMRRALVHGYDEVERQGLHDTVAVDLPKLVGQLDAILGDEARG